jgi:hypothetical protein
MSTNSIWTGIKKRKRKRKKRNAYLHIYPTFVFEHRKHTYKYIFCITHFLKNSDMAENMTDYTTWTGQKTWQITQPGLAFVWSWTVTWDIRSLSCIIYLRNGELLGLYPLGRVHTVLKLRSSRVPTGTHAHQKCLQGCSYCQGQSAPSCLCAHGSIFRLIGSKCWFLSG